MNKLRIILLVLLFPVLVFAAGTFEWDASTEATGYEIYYEGVKVYDLGPVTSVSLQKVLDGRYTIRDSVGESNEVLVVAYYYNATRWDWDDNRISYRGQHTQDNASIDDLNWEITKYYYDGDILSYTRTRTTSWTNRAIGW